MGTPDSHSWPLDRVVMIRVGARVSRPSEVAKRSQCAEDLATQPGWAGYSVLALKVVSKGESWQVAVVKDLADLLASSWPMWQSAWAELPCVEAPSEASWAVEMVPLLHLAEHSAGVKPLVCAWCLRRVLPSRT